MSQGIFKDPELSVSGVNWISDGTKKISLRSLSAGILCAKHNSDLSVTDAAATKLVRQQREWHSSAQDVALTIDGSALERWCLKTIINVMASGWTGSQRVLPPPNIARIAFGLEPWNLSGGLYIADGSYEHSETETVRWTPLYDNRRVNIGGGIIRLMGITLFPILWDGNPQDLLRQLEPHPDWNFTDVKLTHRPKKLNYKRSDTMKTLTINLDWNTCTSINDNRTND